MNQTLDLTFSSLHNIEVDYVQVNLSVVDLYHPPLDFKLVIGSSEHKNKINDIIQDNHYNFQAAN